MGKADKIPENASSVWKIAMANISQDTNEKLVLCKNVESLRSFSSILIKSMWEFKRAFGSAFLGDPKQILWEALMIMQKGFEKYDYGLL